MPSFLAKNKMLVISILFLAGLGLVGWGIRLSTYKHPSDYTEANVTVIPGLTRDPVGSPLDSGSEAGMTDIVITVEGQIFNIDLADTMEKRAAGLSGREPLKEKEGMLFIFPYADKYGFWMKDMKFDLDIIWIKGETVVGVTANVPAPLDSARGEPPSVFNLPSYYPPEPIDKVLEVNAGTAAKYGINRGDTVVLSSS